MEDLSKSLSTLLPSFGTPPRENNRNNNGGAKYYNAVREVLSPFGGSSTIPLVHTDKQQQHQQSPVSALWLFYYYIQCFDFDFDFITIEFYFVSPQIRFFLFQ